LARSLCRCHRGPVLIPPFPTRRSSDLGKLAAVAALIPFVLLIVGLQAFIMEQEEATFTTSFFLGIATGPLIFDLFSALSPVGRRSEEHTSELQSRFDLVCRLLLEKKKY